MSCERFCQTGVPVVRNVDGGIRVSAFFADGETVIESLSITLNNCLSRNFLSLFAINLLVCHGAQRLSVSKYSIFLLFRMILNNIFYMFVVWERTQLLNRK